MPDVNQRLAQLESDLAAVKRGDGLTIPSAGFKVGPVKFLAQLVSGTWRFYQRAPDGQLTDLTGGVEGAVDHAVLANLAYAASGHTGFASSASVHTKYTDAEAVTAARYEIYLPLGDEPTFGQTYVP